eukprot:gene67130-91949_t
MKPRSLALLALVFGLATVRAVVPVPQAIEPEPLPGAKPRNVVFIL